MGCETDHALKRGVDIVCAFVGLIVCAPLMAAVAVLITLDSPGPVLFRQERIGRRFRPFTIYKFRTMTHGGQTGGRRITWGDDPRITRVGRMLRRFKIDEWPQLFNVIKGDMSLVGPRPELRHYVERFRREYETILAIRPGITDLASLKYRDEAAILGRAADPEEEYVKRILPDKIRLAKEYVGRASIRTDVRLILETLSRLIGVGREAT